MLKELRLRNFKCFEDHVLPLRPVTVIVGRNNAGKSTVVEALRLVSLVLERRKSLNFHDVPSWLDIPRRMRGVAPSLRDVDISFENLLFRYGEADGTASITAVLQNCYTVTVHLNPAGAIHAVICDPHGDPVTTKGQAIAAELPAVSILPQIGPLLHEERKLDAEYVRRSISSALSCMHFRNQLLLLQTFVGAFEKMAEESWPGMEVRELKKEGPLGDEFLALLVRNEDFTAEVAWMGHGLQMWLQIMWFLARSQDSASVILDEPDVYMHADL